MQVVCGYCLFIYNYIKDYIIKIIYFLQPFRPEPCELIYADTEYNPYGPIDYKAASIYAAVKRKKNDNNKPEQNKEDIL